MAKPAEIPAEYASAGDGYTLVFAVENRSYDADDAWAAQARRQPDAEDPVATFDIAARAGTVDDDATGEDETGNTVLVLTLDGDDTRAMKGTNYCDLQLTPDAGAPITWLRWQLIVEQDITR